MTDETAYQYHVQLGLGMAVVVLVILFMLFLCMFIKIKTVRRNYDVEDLKPVLAETFKEAVISKN